MNKRHCCFFVFSLAIAMSAVLLQPAAAVASEAETVTTFGVSGGAISINAPASVDLGAGPAGSTLSATLGAVKATDNRAALGASWSATVSTTGFDNVTTPGAARITAVDYSSGVATTSAGIVVLLPGQAAGFQRMTAEGIRAFSATTATGSNSATWQPTVSVNIPADAISGSYTGTIVHSVL